MKKLILFLVMGLVLTGCTSSCTKSTNDTSKSGAVEGCRAQGEKLQLLDRLHAGLVNTDDMTNILSGDTFTKKQLGNMMYGYDLELTVEGEFVDYELCSGDNTRVVEPGYYDTSEASFRNADFVDEGRTSGNFTNFELEDSDETKSLMIEEAGDYSFNVFTSRDGKKWTLSAQKKFTVTE